MGGFAKIILNVLIDTIETADYNRTMTNATDKPTEAAEWIQVKDLAKRMNWNSPAQAKAARQRLQRQGLVKKKFGRCLIQAGDVEAAVAFLATKYKKNRKARSK